MQREGPEAQDWYGGCGYGGLPWLSAGLTFGGRDHAPTAPPPLATGYWGHQIGANKAFEVVALPHNPLGIPIGVGAASLLAGATPGSPAQGHTHGAQVLGNPACHEEDV